MATAPITQALEADAHTKSPFLRRVRIRGYKSIGFCDVQLQPLTILVGRNAAGKSNFLDALAFLRDTMAFGVAEAVKRRGGWASVVSRTGNMQAIEIEIEAGYVCGHPQRRMRIGEDGISGSAMAEPMPSFEGHCITARYSLQVVGGPRSSPVISRESLDLNDETGNETGGFDLQRNSIVLPPKPKREQDPKATGNGGVVVGGGADVLFWKGGNSWSAASTEVKESSSLRRPDLCLLGAIGSQPFLELSDALRFMGYYNFNPNAIRELQKPNPGWLLEKDGANLASVIEGLKELEPESVERVRDYLRMVADEVESLHAIRYGEYETVRFRLRGGSPESQLEFDAASMSDGTLRALASLVAAFQIVLPHGYPSVVGIEEPETALHPSAMRALVDALDEATQRTQVLLTTHSGDLLAERDIAPGQVLVVRNRDRQTFLTPVDPASREIIEEELYSLADLQRMDKLDLDEADLERQAELSREGGA